MIKKALIIGARPFKWEGPWVILSGSSKWEVIPDDDYRGRVAVEVMRPDGTGPVRHLLNGDSIEVSGVRARGVILDGADELGVQSISVNLLCRPQT